MPQVLKPQDKIPAPYDTGKLTVKITSHGGNTLVKEQEFNSTGTLTLNHLVIDMLGPNNDHPYHANLYLNFQTVIVDLMG